MPHKQIELTGMLFWMWTEGTMRCILALPGECDGSILAVVMQPYTNFFDHLFDTVIQCHLMFTCACIVQQFAIDRQTVGSLVVNDKTIADITALEIGNVGENIAVRRAFYLRAANERQLIASYVHSTGMPYLSFIRIRNIRNTDESTQKILIAVSLDGEENIKCSNYLVQKSHFLETQQITVIKQVKYRNGLHCCKHRLCGAVELYSSRFHWSSAGGIDSRSHLFHNLLLPALAFTLIPHYTAWCLTGHIGVNSYSAMP